MLRRDAPVAIYTTGPQLRGTPAVPEPLASLGHFYPDAELTGLAIRLPPGSVKQPGIGDLPASSGRRRPGQAQH